MHTKNKLVYTPLILLFFALLVYVLLRANFISFSHDEGLSYKIIKGDHGPERSANHHVLNTSLMYVFSSFFGDSEFSLRLPNILSFLFYLVFCFYILKESKNIFLIYFGAFLLLINPFLIEFFSLARGYGLAVGFFLPALYFLLKEKKDRNSYKEFLQKFSLSMMFCSLALLANLSAMNFFITILGIFVIQYLLLVKNNNLITLKQHGVFLLVLILACIPLVIGIKRLLFLSELKELFFGEETLVDSIKSIINSSFYISEKLFWINTIILYFITGTFFIGVVISIFTRNFYNNLFKMTFLIGGVLLGEIIEHYFFDSKYPSQRTALIFIPAYGLFLYYLVEYLYEKINSKKVSAFISVFLLISLIFPGTILFISKMNLLYTSTWKFDYCTKDVIEIINNQSKIEKKRMNIGSPWQFEPELNYYITSRKMNIEQASRGEVNHEADFIYDSKYNYFDTKNYIQVKEFKGIDAVLYKRKTLN